MIAILVNMSSENKKITICYGLKYSYNNIEIETLKALLNNSTWVLVEIIYKFTTEVQRSFENPEKFIHDLV